MDRVPDSDSVGGGFDSRRVDQNNLSGHQSEADIDIYKKTEYGLVAQLGERRVRNAEVMGSNPTRSTRKKDLQNASPFSTI